MLKVNPTRVFPLSIKVRIPSETEADQFDEHKLTGRFRAVSRTELDKLTTEGVDDRTFLRRILVNVEGLGDAEGVPLSGNAAVEAVIEEPLLSVAAMDAFRSHYQAARSGN